MDGDGTAHGALSYELYRRGWKSNDGAWWHDDHCDRYHDIADAALIAGLRPRCYDMGEAMKQRHLLGPDPRSA